MHLKYPRKRGYFYWDELGCLARALGFQVSVFYGNLPEELRKQGHGISIEHFLEVADHTKCFHKALDRTFNIHTDEWNLCAMKRAIPLLDSRVIMFEELQSIRVAFQLYEAQDTKGMIVEENVLLRAMKMCGRMISPLKMMHRIKHMRQHLEEPDRIQLHEFLDLLLWCEEYEGIEVHPPDFDLKKDDRQLFQIDDFDHVLSHHDGRLHDRLNQQYIEQEWKFTKEKHDVKALPRDVPPVNTDIRKKQAHHHRQKYKALHNEINNAQRRVYQAKAGFVRPRPITAPDPKMYNQTEDQLSHSPTRIESRAKTVMDIAGHWIRPKTPSTPTPVEYIPRPCVREYQRPQTPSAVKSDDILQTENTMDALKFEMETIEMKYQKQLREDMDSVLPGYREKMALRPPPEPTPELPPPKPPRKARPSQETLQHLAYPPFRGPPPSHAKICDARFRGWHGTKTRSGPHFILVGPSFDNSLQGQMLAKLHARSMEQCGRIPYIYRYTKKWEVVPENACPYSAPDLLITDESNFETPRSAVGGQRRKSSVDTGKEATPRSVVEGSLSEAQRKSSIDSGKEATPKGVTEGSLGEPRTKSSIDSETPRSLAEGSLSSEPQREPSIDSELSKEKKDDKNECPVFVVDNACKSAEDSHKTTDKKDMPKDLATEKQEESEANEEDNFDWSNFKLYDSQSSADNDDNYSGRANEKSLFDEPRPKTKVTSIGKMGKVAVLEQILEIEEDNESEKTTEQEEEEELKINLSKLKPQHINMADPPSVKKHDVVQAPRMTQVRLPSSNEGLADMLKHKTVPVPPGDSIKYKSKSTKTRNDKMVIVQKSSAEKQRMNHGNVVYVYPHVYKVAQRGPTWLMNVLTKQVRIPSGKVRSNRKACQRLVRTMSDTLSADMRKKLTESIG